MLIGSVASSSPASGDIVKEAKLFDNFKNTSKRLKFDQVYDNRVILNRNEQKQ